MDSFSPFFRLTDKSIMWTSLESMRMNASRHWVVALILTASVLLGGCGGEQRFHLSGNVTYKGKPVPFGYLIFEPDTTKGNSGGPGNCKIENGKYDTRSEDGTGILGGPHVVRIRGFDAIASGKGSGTKEVAMPGVLFSEFTVSEDLPKKNGTKDFDVK